MQERLHCFISYAHANPDDSFAQSLYQHLDEWGFLPWLDKHNIPTGISAESSGWIDSIDKGLRASQVLIGLISPTSLSRPNVQREWKWALENNLRIFLIRLDEFNKRDMSHQFIEALWIDKDNIEQLKLDLDELANKRDDFKPIVTDTNRQSRSLNQDILSDLEQLGKETPASPKKDKLIGSAIPSKDDEAILRDRIRRYWLESILKPSLQEAAAFNIALSLQADAVIEHEDLGNFPLGGSIDIYNSYKALKSFLIMGEAGSGKTVMLLQLATKLLRHEKTDIPLVLNLSSWGNAALPLEDWLVKEAEITYQIRAASFKRWLADKKLILLLDGLDEIKEEVRAERIQRINAFRRANQSIPIVICSRVAEYRLTTEDKTEKKLDFPHALRLEALSKEQIEAYLSQAEFSEVKALYDRDSIVQDLAQIPFLLTTMAYTYKGEHIRQLELKEGNNNPARLKHLFALYITKQLKSHAPLKYSEAKIKEYLEWIAVKTSSYGTVFRADMIKISWFSDKPHLLKLNYRLFSIIIVLFLAPIPILGFVLADILGLVLFSLLAALLIHLFQISYNTTVYREDVKRTHYPEVYYLKNSIAQLKASWADNSFYLYLTIVPSILISLLVGALESIFPAWSVWLCIGLLLIIMAWVVGFYNKRKLEFFDIILIPLAIGLFIAFQYSLYQAMVFPFYLKSLFNGMIVASIALVLFSVEEERASPTQNLPHLVLAFGIVLLAGLTLWLAMPRLSYWGLIALLGIVILYKFGYLLQQIGLGILTRLVLPTNLSQFLFEMTERQIMRPIGGGHLFRHDYFRQSLLVESQISQIQIQMLIQELLHSENETATSDALVRFGGIAVEPLLETLEQYTTSSLATILTRIGEPAVEPLITFLRKSSNSEIRRMVIKILTNIGDSRAVEPLIAALNDEAYVSSSAAYALGELGDSRAVEPLIAALDDEPFVSSSAALALGELGDNRAVDPLITALYDKSRDVRSSAAVALAKLGDNRAVDLFIGDLKSREWDIRLYAADVLGKIGDNRAAEPLIAALKDEDWAVRTAAATALSNLRESSAVQPLIELLQDTTIVDMWQHNTRVCDTAADALRKIGTPEALQALKEAGFKAEE